MKEQMQSNDKTQDSDQQVTRRSFLNWSAVGAASALSMVPFVANAAQPYQEKVDSEAEGDSEAEDAEMRNSSRIPQGDIAVLRFLAAAELVEDDLWQQYCELAVNNPGFYEALTRIDPALVRYICDDRDDERSHAAFINSFLKSIGEEPINLDPFRTLPGVQVQGSEGRGRLTNLTALNVDTSWYNRYRSAENPDFGAQIGQVATITNRPTIPTSDSLSSGEMQTIAHSAAFHFAAIEQGGSSLYVNLLNRVRSPQAIHILASIGPTEVYHFATFHKSLENLFGWDSGDGLVFPDLQSNRDIAFATFPEPTQFFGPNLAPCSVIRPANTANAGAVAAATGLVNSGLFAGQSQGFFDAVVALANGADNANKRWHRKRRRFFKTDFPR